MDRVRPDELKHGIAMLLWEGVTAAKAIGIDFYEVVRRLAFNQDIDLEFAEFTYFYSVNQGAPYESAAVLLIMRRWLADDRGKMTHQFDREDRKLWLHVSRQYLVRLDPMISQPQSISLHLLPAYARLWSNLSRKVPSDDWGWSKNLPKLCGGLDVLSAHCFWCLNLHTFKASDEGKLATCPSCANVTVLRFWHYRAENSEPLI